MDSSQLTNSGFVNWYPFNRQTIKNAPAMNGVYVIRMFDGQSFGRVKGESDIVYIGKAKRKNGLKVRVADYFRKSSRTTTEFRINRFANKFDLDISWQICQKPEDLEMTLLKRYEEEHYELPPLNRSSIHLVGNYRDLTAKFVIRH
ncbi:MAG: hypothetical protein ACTSQY_08185 [Candidatus Odinarchaeia archaeon]